MVQPDVARDYRLSVAPSVEVVRFEDWFARTGLPREPFERLSTMRARLPVRRIYLVCRRFAPSAVVGGDPVARAVLGLRGRPVAPVRTAYLRVHFAVLMDGIVLEWLPGVLDRTQRGERSLGVYLTVWLEGGGSAPRSEPMVRAAGRLAGTLCFWWRLRPEESIGWRFSERQVSPSMQRDLERVREWACRTLDGWRQRTPFGRWTYVQNVEKMEEAV